MVCCLAAVGFSLEAAEPMSDTVTKAPPVTAEMDSIVASVNGSPISLSDILPESRTEELGLYAAYSGDELYRAVQAVRRKVLDEQINRKLIVADYEKDPFDIPEQYLESAMDMMAVGSGIRSRSEFARHIRAAGLDMDRLRQQVRERLIVQAMLARRRQVAIHVTPQEVFQYFEKNQEMFSRPEQWELGMILISRDAANREETLKHLETELRETPDSFAKLAGTHSSGPNAANGGVLGLLEKKRLRSEFAAALKDAVPGQVVGPVSTGEGDYFLRILRIVPAQEADFLKLEPEIRAKLEDVERQKAVKSYCDRLREEAVIRIYL